MTTVEYAELLDKLKAMLHRYTINMVLGALAEALSEGAATENSDRLKVALRLMKMTKTAEVKALS